MDPTTARRSRPSADKPAAPTRPRRGRGRHRPPTQAAQTGAPIVLVMPGSVRFIEGIAARTETVVIHRFPNGELHVGVSPEVRERDCVIVGSISPPPGNIERLTLIAHTLRRAGARRITAVLPYLAYARQDRAPAAESLGLEWVGEQLRSSGISAVVTVDVHSPAAEELLGIPLQSLSPAALLAEALDRRWRTEVTFVAPDEGARDRCLAVARAAGAELPIVWAGKRRTPAGVTHRALSGTPGQRAIVVDDILDTGGTLISCCRQLRAAGVQEIGVLVTHGLFTGTAWQPLVSETVDELWITDTVLARHRPPEARITAIAPLLARAFE